MLKTLSGAIICVYFSAVLAFAQAEIGGGQFALADDDPDLELIRDLSEHLRNVRELLRKGEHVQ